MYTRRLLILKKGETIKAASVYLNNDSAPSIKISVPVICEDKSEAKNVTKSPTCSDFPGL